MDNYILSLNRNLELKNFTRVKYEQSLQLYFEKMNKKILDNFLDKEDIDLVKN